ncbi:MAG: hypothetical protein M3539_11220 [Acidobacteriota bacterium]|nr:hypothetical protein [Acidobacteriota bacterium]
MTRHRKLLLSLLTAGVLILAGLFLAERYCPPEGIAFTQDRREVHRLKNRTTRPKATDFDPRVTLSALLQPGNDSNRWSTSHAARVEGYVMSLANAEVELANCYTPCRRDIHINLALRPDAPASEQVVLEVTPELRKWAATQGWDWSEAKLKQELIGHWCSFEGWLFFDKYHAGESENIAPGRQGNWRATAWEIHPVTNFQVLR